MRIRGWSIDLLIHEGHRFIDLYLTETPANNRQPDVPLPKFGNLIDVPPTWGKDQIVRRVFATLQYLTDHELREQFMIGEMRPYEAHEPSVTGEQKDWFVEHESAVRGY